MISKKILNALTKEQLIFLINQYQNIEYNDYMNSLDFLEEVIYEKEQHFNKD